MTTFTNTIKHGRRAHTIGDFFPYRMMVQGTFDNLKYWVIYPDGSKGCHYRTAKDACNIARLLYITQHA